MGGAARVLEKSYALLGREYMLLSLRMGYHFTTVEAVCAAEMSKNTSACGTNRAGRPWRTGAADQADRDPPGEAGFESLSRGFLDTRTSYQSREDIAGKLPPAGAADHHDQASSTWRWATTESSSGTSGGSRRSWGWTGPGRADREPSGSAPAERVPLPSRHPLPGGGDLGALFPRHPGAALLLVYQSAGITRDQISADFNQQQLLPRQPGGLPDRGDPARHRAPAREPQALHGGRSRKDSVEGHAGAAGAQQGQGSHRRWASWTGGAAMSGSARLGNRLSGIRDHAGMRRIRRDRMIWAPTHRSHAMWHSGACIFCARSLRSCG